MKEIDPNLPIDKTAAFVVSKSSHQGFDFKCGDKIVSMSPIPTRKFPGFKQHDLTGVKFGRFTVIGCATFVPKNYLTSRANTVRWVAKCTCGRYQIFTTRAVNRAKVIGCVECEKLQFLSKRDEIVMDIIKSKSYE